jgi:hypothetical protein
VLPAGASVLAIDRERHPLVDVDDLLVLEAQLIEEVPIPDEERSDRLSLVHTDPAGSCVVHDIGSAVAQQGVDVAAIDGLELRAHDLRVRHRLLDLAPAKSPSSQAAFLACA